MSLLFIADLHLSPSRPEITQAFYSFLKTTAKNADALYILGDFFEVWLGDDDDTPLYHEVINALANYSNNGTAVYFMHGNRDFLAGEAFAQQAKLTLLNDPTTIVCNGVSYLLMHGDSLCTKDHDFMAFRAMSRSPEWQQALLEKPLNERKAFAAQVREKSQTMNSRKAEDIMDVTPEEVVRIMEQHQTPILIHGHTHRPNIHDVTLNSSSNMANPTTGKRIVLGDWESDLWYVEINNEGYELVHQAIA